MKLSKNIILMLVVGIFLAAAAALFSFYTRQVQESVILRQNVSTAQRILSQFTSEKRSLEPQLTQLEDKFNLAQSTLRNIEQKFPTTADSLTYSEALTQLAGDLDLTVISLASGEFTYEQIDEVDYATYGFEMEAEGKLSNLVDFVEELNVSPLFESARINKLELSRLDSEEPHLLISILVYAYEGG
ncbi:MAG: hypothetical protein V1894_06800 [Chloroflexota bacterium]